MNMSDTGHSQNSGAPGGLGWRDLAAELTAEQIADLAAEEQEWAGQPGGDLALFDLAQDHAEANRVDAGFAHVAVPAGVERTHHWHLDDAAGWRRGVEGRTRRPVPGVTVLISGEQGADGGVTAVVVIESDGAELTAAEARLVAAAITEAAAEVDRLGGPVSD
jgi:hypothetical protein